LREGLSFKGKKEGFIPRFNTECKVLLN